MNPRRMHGNNTLNAPTRIMIRETDGRVITNVALNHRRGRTIEWEGEGRSEEGVGKK